MESVTKKFHQVIREAWLTHKVYNVRGKDEAIFALNTLKATIDQLIHHLKNS